MSTSFYTQEELSTIGLKSYGITIKDFAGISARVTMWAMTDDYSGEYLVGPTVPDEFRNVTGGEIVLDEYATIATGCTILPGVHIPVGAAVGGERLPPPPKISILHRIIFCSSGQYHRFYRLSQRKYLRKPEVSELFCLCEVQQESLLRQSGREKPKKYS